MCCPQWLARYEEFTQRGLRNVRPRNRPTGLSFAAFLAARVILCVSHNFGRLRFARLGPVKTTISETAAQVVQASEQPDSSACDKKSLKVVPPPVHPE